jgi:hypothetical protein
LIPKMLDAIKRMPPKMDGIFSPSLFRNLARSAELQEYAPERNPLLGRSTSFYGMPVVENAAFPFQTGCPTCSGTGEGEESTYCPKCKGAGENRYEGMVRHGDQTILLTVPLPKRFAPRFPSGVVAAPPIARGLA